MYPYISLTDEQVKEMLDVIGLSSLDDLYNEVPESLRFDKDLNLPKSKSESEVYDYLTKVAYKNDTIYDKVCFLGAGAYDRYIPSVIGYLTSRSEFQTSYTPYQPEISQGTLTYIFEYQTMMAKLTGMEMSNASLYDGGTAAMEAVLMTLDKAKKKKVLVSETVDPQTIQILKTYAEDRNIEVELVAAKGKVTDLEDLEKKLSKDVGTVLVQSPNYYGYIENMAKVEEFTHSVKKNYLVMKTDPISLGVFKKPSEYNVDVVVGEGQQLGVALNYGGPYLGFMCFNNEFLRKIPGRIVGQTEDLDGKRSFVLTLSAREQHIKRDRATSNICSNQGLNVLVAAIYMSIMGKKGIREVAEQSLQKAHYMYDKLLELDGVKKLSDAPFFDEFAIGFEKDAQEVLDHMYEKGFFAGIKLPDENGLIIAVTEKRTKEEIDSYVESLKEVL